MSRQILEQMIWWWAGRYWSRWYDDEQADTEADDMMMSRQILEQMIWWSGRYWSRWYDDEQTDTGADHSRGIIQYKTFRSEDLHQLYLNIFGSKRLVFNNSPAVICFSICLFINSNTQQWTFTVSLWYDPCIPVCSSGHVMFLHFMH